MLLFFMLTITGCFEDNVVNNEPIPIFVSTRERGNSSVAEVDRFVFTNTEWVKTGLSSTAGEVYITNLKTKGKKRCNKEAVIKESGEYLIEYIVNNEVVDKKKILVKIR